MTIGTHMAALLGRRGRQLATTALLISMAGLAALGLAACDNGDSPQPASTPPASATQSTSGSPGQVVFMQYCNVCHPGGGRGAGPQLAGRDIPDNQIRFSVRNGRGGRMPAFDTNSITDQQLSDLIAYIHSLP